MPETPVYQRKAAVGEQSWMHGVVDVLLVINIRQAQDIPAPNLEQRAISERAQRLIFLPCFCH